MKKFYKIILVFISLVFLNSCAKPKVVEVVMPGDNDLNCQELEIAVAEALNFKRKAEFVKTGTGGNTARVMIFWPAWAKSLHNADLAIIAADDRTYHLTKIMKKKNCKGVDVVNAQINKASAYENSVASQLKELKEMYKAGDLTKEEYKKAKAKMLEE